MLKTLVIKNVATIKSLEVEFSSGFNVIVGETGAGKSVILDSLNFALGSKLDKTLLRYGENFMRVDASFTNLSEDVLNFLNKNEIEIEDELILTRTYYEDGKSNIRICGTLATLSLLKDLSLLLADTYNQHESTLLLNPKKHMEILDSYSKNLGNAKSQIKLIIAKIKSLKTDLSQFGGSDFEREKQIEILSYQINELETSKLKDGELENLTAKFKLFANSEKIVASITSALEVLSKGEINVEGLLSQASHSIQNISNFTSQISEISKRINSLSIEINDIENTLQDIRSEIDFDENELEKIDLRIDAIKSVIKKYGGTETLALEFLENANQTLVKISSSKEEIQKIEAFLKIENNNLQSACQTLSNYRKANAMAMEELVIKSLKELSMKNAEFKINFKTREPSENGCDDVEFTFTANAGQQLKALAKTASGGEMSRFMLAFKEILAGVDNVSTLILDEIDAGISGEVGVTLAKKLKRLSTDYQIICITHLPQVVASANHFILVTKTVVDSNTQSTASILGETGILKQIATLSSGDNLSEIAMSHAKHLREEMK